MEKKLKVAVLYENWGEEEEAPPEPVKKKRSTGKKRKKREKHDREEIFEALESLGHEPSYQVLDGDEKSLTALCRCDADLFFNIVESYAGDDNKEMHVAAYLDLLGRRYTGAGPQALHLAQDKGLAKKLFAFHGIRTPFFATCFRGNLDHCHDISFPLIVKPVSEDGSIGIDQGSVVKNVKELMERIQYIQEEFDSPALVEEYIEGREIYAGIIGNQHPEVLPMIELDLSRLPAGMAKVAGTEVKWDKDSEAYKVTKSAPVEDLDEKITELLSKTALATYRALRLRDYGRIDMRLTEKGEVYVIEANPNPWLSSNSEFYMAAKKSGRSYAEMIQEIVDLALWDRRRRDMPRLHLN
ncbi:MAG TPA: D-alanine--D-alanine ligase [Candidatus Angelobacter sp.]|jgi:D-alanine-D-alanine ligase|nr:D-alanine--D-alanine ligase [Candidatus Angelobacter sp.]